MCVYKNENEGKKKKRDFLASWARRPNFDLARHGAARMAQQAHTGREGGGNSGSAGLAHQRDRRERHDDLDGGELAKGEGRTVRRR